MFNKSNFQYDAIIWSTILGVLLSRMGTSMTVPFLTFFLYHKAGISIAHAGLIAGIAFLVYAVTGFLGGSLSDRYGRKELLLGSVIGYAAVFFGFGIFGEELKNPMAIGIVFALLNAGAGLSRAWTETLGQAILADRVDIDQKINVFSLRYTAANVGAALGPLIGAGFGVSGGVAGFYVTGTIFAIYAIVLFYCFVKYPDTKEIKYEDVTFKQAIAVILRDKTMRYFTIGCCLVLVGFTQYEAILAVIINKYTGSLHLFSILITINALLIICIQMPLSKYLEGPIIYKALLLGTLFVVLGLIGFGMAKANIWFYIVSGCFFTLGEILVFPLTGVVIDQLAPEHLRGAYFGASAFQFLGRAFGPVLGGTLYQMVGGEATLIIVAGIVATSAWFFYKGFFADNDKHLVQH
jgi:MFS family permease